MALAKTMKSYFNKVITALSLAITLSGAVAAQSQSDENTEVTRTGTISGRVVNDSGQPLANASVAVYAFGSLKPGRTTTTDSDGGFQVTGLDPAAYLIFASFPTYAPALSDLDGAPSRYYHVGDSVRIELVKGGVITGTVTRATGEPVVVVPVRAHMVRDSNGQPSRYGAPFGTQTTDDRGVYRIYGLPAGTYVVSAGGGARNSSGYNVDAFGTDAPTYAPSATRDSATEISVRSGEETANVDIHYRGEPGHAVSGSASSEVTVEHPMGISIALTSIFGAASQPDYLTSQPPGARGFSFSSVADGDYYITAQTLSSSGEWVFSEPRRIKVKGADVTGIELTAKPLGSITGRVALEDSKAPECKGKRRPLFGETLITPWRNEKTAPKDQPRPLWGLGAPTLPDKKGDFALRNLAPGQYRFDARPMARYWYLKSISWLSSPGLAEKASPANRPVDAARNWTTLKSGDRFSGLTMTLAEGAASFHGQIETAEGQKLPPRLFVYLVPAERENADDVLRFFGSPVLADGGFALNNLPPGRYWVIARIAGENESNILSKLRLPDEAEARAKLLHDAGAAKIETEFKPCQNTTDYRLPFQAVPPGR